MKSKKIALITLSLFSSVAMANNIYMGLGVGESYLSPEYYNSSKKEKDSDLANQIFAGYDFNNPFSIELSYSNLGDLDIKDKSLGYDLYSLHGLASYPLSFVSEDLSIYGKAGVSYLDLENKDDVRLHEKNELSFSTGVGLKWQFSENWFTRAEYDYYNKDIKAAFIQVGYSFGLDNKKPEPIKVIEPKPIIKTIDVHGIFDFDKTIVNNSERLDALVKKLETADKIKIIGYTDESGSEEYNKALSLDRAEFVKKYLVEKGIPSNIIETDGFGESKQLMKGNTDSELLMNRRIKIIYQ